VFGGEGVKVFPVDTVLTSREPEGNQVAFFNPSQDRYFTDTAVPGNGAGSEILRVVIFHFSFQGLPP
jgi:hypothetical protein